MNNVAENISLETVNSTLSKNVRQLRARRSLTLDELASQAGVSKGMLVQIEQSRTNPSIGTLCKLANALGVTISRLIEEPVQPLIKKMKLAQLTNFWKGPVGSTAKLLAGIDDRNLIEFWDWELESGHGHRSDPHPRGTKEVVYVLKGLLSVTVGDMTYTVNAHEAILIPGDQHHQYKNEAKSNTHFVMVVVEPVGMPS
ncbi:MAG: XRE family transcriptional regulator [Chloroflexota bacterium]